MTVMLNAHEGQVRKFDGLPYSTHPLAVAKAVKDAGGDDNMIIAALLHDTVEDTDVTIDYVDDIFGSDVAALVNALTRRSNESYFEFVERTIASGDRAIAVKRADVIHNKSTLPAGHGLHRRYAQTLEMLDKAMPVTIKILASAAEPGMTLWNGKVIKAVSTNDNNETAIRYVGQKYRDWFRRDDLIEIMKEKR
jgi:(p)ppGpp synthase/HD superfamily hydrolase